jgi:pyruvyltransferase
MINMYWSGHGRIHNFGDMLNPWLVKRISGQPVEFTRTGENIHMVIGSILGANLGRWKSNCIVWGSGFVRPGVRTLKPKAIYAVRGPLSREEFLSQGIECPEVYGDPGLLLPRYYKPTKEAKYKLGIIPHYIDAGHEWIRKHLNYCKYEDILVIDVLDHIERVIESICSCEMIISSSLHGIVTADAYGIPSLWVEFSDKVIGKGFKFRDYFMSVGIEPYEPFQIRDSGVELIDVYREIKLRKLNIDLDKLMEACPFKSEA